MEKKPYTTIDNHAQDEFIEKKSRFIGYAAPVETEAEAMAFIEKIRSQNWDATHNVYAFVLRDGQTKRYSDDGEPQGTAGVPVLDCIQKEGICDVAVVVTRYFGGTLLGAGGLVRAYSHGASIAIHAARRKTMQVCSVVEMEFDYSLYGKITYILPKYALRVEDSDFGAVVKMRLIILSEQFEKFKKELDELTAAAVFPYIRDEIYAEIS